MLVLDAKRGDIGSTAEHYAREAFGRYAADAVTVNPYLGTDAAAPFLAAGGVLALCHTSNPGSAELQDLDVGGAPAVRAGRADGRQALGRLGECGLVVGATYPEQLGAVRRVVGDLPILVPGVGTQGGDLAASVRAGSTGPAPACWSAPPGDPLRVHRRRLRRAARAAGRRDARRDSRRAVRPSARRR